MGAILVKFRKEKTTTEILEGLEERIREIEKYTLNTQEQKKRFVFNFLGISIGIYVVAFILFYFFYFPLTWNERVFYLVPMCLFPLVIIVLRKLLTWYFQRKLNKNSSKLTVLRAEKKKILEQVMDKETYKVAVNLLTRFGDKNNGSKSLLALTPRVTNSTSTSSLNRTTSCLNINSSQLRGHNSSYAFAMTPTQRSKVSSSTNLLIPMVSPRQQTLALSDNISNMSMRVEQELPQKTPFPIIYNQNRSLIERIVDVLIGDGPQDRFAMICKECFSHNGMAPKEEYDYATFRCAFCNTLNPSRKSRPVAPRLSLQQATTTAIKKSSSSSSDLNSSSEDDGDTLQPGRLLITEDIATNTTAPLTDNPDEELVDITESTVNDPVAKDPIVKKME